MLVSPASGSPDGRGSKDRTIAEVPPPGGAHREGQNAGNDHAHDPLRAPFDEAVAVQAHAQDEVDAIPGHDDGEVAEYRGEDESEGVDPAGKAAVERDQVNEQGDQGPDFLGV